MCKIVTLLASVNEAQSCQTCLATQDCSKTTVPLCSLSVCVHKCVGEEGVCLAHTYLYPYVCVSVSIRVCICMCICMCV